MNRFFARTVFFAILFMTICGCGENIPDSTPTPIETETISDTPTLSPTSTEVVEIEPSPTITEQIDVPTATALPDALLSETGPWLIFTVPSKKDPISPYLWAINPDGTGLTQLSDKAARRFEVNPVRGTDGKIAIALITSDGDASANLQLSILKMPGGEIETTIDLTSPETAYTDQDPNDEDSDYWTLIGIAAAIKFNGSLEWSPDGKWLAFVGAMDGPSADVYSYELATGTIRRLTSGPDNAFQLLWSPDSAWILHTAKSAWEHAGGQYEPVSGVWAASPDGGQVYELERERPTKFVGWLSPDTVVAYSGEGYGFEYALRTINIANGKIIYLVPRCFSDLAYNLEHNTYLVAINSFAAETCELSNPWKEGLFLVSQDDIHHVPGISYQPGERLSWSADADMFLLDPSAGITLQGEVVTELPDSILGPSTAVSDDGRLRAWWSSDHLNIAAAPDYEPYPVFLDEVLSESAYMSKPEWVP